jgi:hypothetical protein
VNLVFVFWGTIDVSGIGFRQPPNQLVDLRGPITRDKFGGLFPKYLASPGGLARLIKRRVSAEQALSPRNRPETW